MAKRKPELAAFRVLPPEFDPPTKRMPDGKTPPSTDSAQERWGPVWDRYYALDVEYFTGGLGSSLLKVMSRNFLWTTKLASTPMLETEVRASAALHRCPATVPAALTARASAPQTRDRMAERVSALASDLRGAAKTTASHRGLSSVAGGLPSSAHDEARAGGVLARSTQARCAGAIPTRPQRCSAPHACHAAVGSWHGSSAAERPCKSPSGPCLRRVARGQAKMRRRQGWRSREAIRPLAVRLGPDGAYSTTRGDRYTVNTGAPVCLAFGGAAMLSRRH